MGGGGVTTTNPNSVTGQRAFDEAMSAYQGLIQSMWTTNLPNGGFNYTQPSGPGGTGTSRGDRRFIPRIDDGGGGGMGSAGMGNLNPGGLGGSGTGTSRGDRRFIPRIDAALAPGAPCAGDGPPPATIACRPLDICCPVYGMACVWRPIPPAFCAAMRDACV